MTTMLLSRNFSKPSNVCASPEMAVPAAAKREPMMPKTMLKACWKRASIPVKMDIMPVRIEEIKEVMESKMEAILKS